MSPVQDDPKRSLTNRYDREASVYRELWAPVLKLAGLSLLRGLAHVPARRVIDVGTGVGSLLPELRAMFPEALVLGADRSLGMLRMAPTGTPLAVMDASELGVATASMDLVLLIFMLFHLDRPLDGLREARRIVRSGGSVASITWAGDLESAAMRVWTECLDAHGATKADPATATRHDPVDTPQKMEALLRAAGFGSVRAWEDELVSRIDLEHLLRLKTSMGSAKPRFDSLTPSARKACVASARRKMKRLGPEDFVARGNVVYAAASV